MLLLLVPIFNDLDLGHWCLFFGKAFGKNKLAKNISPGKTIEGAVGGLLSNIIIVFILFYFGFKLIYRFYDYFCHSYNWLKYLW